MSISEQRKRVIRAIERLLATLPSSKYTSEDYQLDTVARVILNISDRPKDTFPYLGWLLDSSTNSITIGFNSTDFANLVRLEASQKLIWHPTSQATKYTQPFEEIGLRGRFPWCAAFVHWCLNKYGVSVPLMCNEYKGYSYALVEAWQKMAQTRGWYKDNDGKYEPKKGDIVLFDWEQRNIHESDTDWEDHIGVFLEPINKEAFLCGEGNCNNQSGLFKRNYVSVQGYISLPYGLKEI
jgi:hypothetical protein